MPVYELFCLARPHLAKDKLAAVIKTACTTVFNSQGVLTDVQSYDIRELAYPIRKAGSKFEEAMMWQMQFLAKPSALPDMNRNLQINEDVLRWIITKKRQHPANPNTHRVAKAAQRLLDQQGVELLPPDEQHAAPH